MPTWLRRFSEEIGTDRGIIRNLFLISTDTQLIVAKYAITMYGIDNAALILTPNHKTIRDRLLDLVRNDPTWEVVVTFRRSSSLLNLFNLILQVKRITFEWYEFELFMGSYFSPVHHFIFSHIRTSRVILLSDGLTSLRAIEERMKSKKHYRGLGRFSNLFFKLRPINKLIYFSPLPMLAPVPPDEHVYFSFSKAQYVVKKETILFIGAPLVEMNLLTLRELEGLIRILKFRNKKKQITYVYHPKEKAKPSLEKLVSTKKYRRPFESEIGTWHKIPGTIMSLYSAVMANLCASYLDVRFIVIRYRPLEGKRAEKFPGMRVLVPYFEKLERNFDNFQILQLADFAK